MTACRRSEAGLTLIELVATMAVFALVATMGVQALSGTLRQRDRLEALAQQAADLSLGTTLLRADLSAMLPVLFHPPEGGSRSALHLSGDGRTLSFSISGQPDLPPVAAQGLHRVEWRLDVGQGQLMRRVWPVLNPASGAAVMPEVAYLSGVRGWSLRSHWPQLGWLPGVESSAPRVAEQGEGDRDGPLVALVNGYSDRLPNAVELTLEIDGLGSLVLMETLR